MKTNREQSRSPYALDTAGAIYRGLNPHVMAALRGRKREGGIDDDTRPPGSSLKNVPPVVHSPHSTVEKNNSQHSPLSVEKNNSHQSDEEFNSQILVEGTALSNTMKLLSKIQQKTIPVKNIEQPSD